MERFEPLDFRLPEGRVEERDGRHQGNRSEVVLGALIRVGCISGTRQPWIFRICFTGSQCGPAHEIEHYHLFHSAVLPCFPSLGFT